MADIFISYSKVRASAAAQLASRLGDLGYAVWWDTSLVPTGLFEEEINRQLDAAKAVIVIWSAESVRSKWVRSEAAHADRQNKLINTHLPGIDPVLQLPKPYDQIHSVLVDDMPAIVRALDVHTTPRSGRVKEAPVSSFASVAEAEKRLFQEAERLGTVAAYDYYLNQLPNGRYASIVRSRVREPLTKANADVAEREQRGHLPGNATSGTQRPSTAADVRRVSTGAGVALALAVFYVAAHYVGVPVPWPSSPESGSTKSPTADERAKKEEEAAARVRKEALESNLASISEQVALRVQQLVQDEVEGPLQRLKLCTAQWTRVAKWQGDAAEDREKNDLGPPYSKPHSPSYCYRYGLKTIQRACSNGSCTLRSKVSYDLSGPRLDIAIDAIFGPFDTDKVVESARSENIQAQYEIYIASPFHEPMSTARKVLRWTDEGYQICQKKSMDLLYEQKIGFDDIKKEKPGKYCTDYSINIWSGRTTLADGDPFRLAK